MTAWKPIVVGVDGSDESAGAVLLGSKIAEKAEAALHLVHGTHEVTAIPVSLPSPMGTSAVKSLSDKMTARARKHLEEQLRGHVPAGTLETLRVELGNPAWVLRNVAQDLGADLVVLGGKHHAAPTRWFGGSTVHHAIRTIDRPILVTTTLQKTIGRVLVGVDLSYASKPTLEAAARIAALFGAELKVLHVVEPLPFMPDPGLRIDAAEYATLTTQEFEQLVAGAPGMQNAERQTLEGRATDVIHDVAADWKADLVVVGSHGKGWVDRVLVGSATQRLINHLPSALLVVPVRAPKGGSTTLALSESK